MKKLKVSMIIEVTLDADKELIEHFAVTGETTDAIKLSIERAEIKVQSLLDKYGKRFNAVIGADYGTVDIRE